MASAYPVTPELPMIGDPGAFQGGAMGEMPMGLDQMVEAMPAPIMPANPPESIIEKLKPDSELEKETREKLESMFKFSQKHMGNFYPRWNWQEQKIQAYISLPDYEQAVREFENNRGAPPEPVKVVVPYSYATIHAAATFLASVLLGRRPIFPIMAVRGTTTDKARYVEQALQSNIEFNKGYETLWQYIWDSLVYSFGANRVGWSEQWGKSLRIIGGQREVIDGLKYAGNKLNAIDPYRFFPDPRVPMHEVSRRGDFCFWTTDQSKMILYDMEKDGLLKWTKEACDKAKGTGHSPELGPVSDSRRRAKIGTDGGWFFNPQNIVGFVEIKEGTVRLVPKDWKFGDEARSELWKFSWTPYQIIQAEPLGMAHEKHPVSCCEPTTFGHEFGSIAMSDLIGVFQDMISWLVNSRMENVRTTINNQFIVDPGRIEMQDLRTPAPGRAVRLKRAAIGTDVREAIHQLTVMDVTQGHFNDISMLRMLADTATGINDNLRGVQSQGGRKSATEARMSMQAGASRLSQMAVRISSQGFSDLTDQMIMNIQQFMPQEMWVEMTGDDGQPQSSLLTPDMIIGSYNYQVSDGALPYDKMMLLEVWKEILFGVAKDPQLRQVYSLDKIFEYVAELGGAKNISTFKNPPAPPGMPPMGVNPGANGAIPVGGALPPPPMGVAGQQLALPAPA